MRMAKIERRRKIRMIEGSDRGCCQTREEEEEEEERGGSRSNFMVDLFLSQPLEIAKQFTIIQSINLSRARGTRCP